MKSRSDRSEDETSQSAIEYLQAWEIVMRVCHQHGLHHRDDQKACSPDQKGETL